MPPESKRPAPKSTGPVLDSTWSRFKFDYIANRNVAFLISGLFMVVFWIWIFAVGGLKYGIDFTGGIRHVFKFNRPSTTDLLSSVRDAALVVDPASQVQNIGKVSEGEVVIQVKGFELIEKARAAVERAPVTSMDDLRGRLAGMALFDDEFYMRLEAVGDTSSELILKALPIYVNEVTASKLMTELENKFGKTEGRTDLNKIPSPERLFRIVQAEAAARIAGQILLRMETAKSTAEFAPLIADAGGDPKLFEALYLLRQPTLEEVQTDLHQFAGKPAELAAAFLKIYPAAFSVEFMPTIQKIISGKESRALYGSVEEAIGRTGLTPGSKLGLIMAEKFYTGPFVLIKTDHVSSRIGAELRKQAVAVVSLSLLAMLLYVWIRFEFRFAIGAVITLFHDAMTMIPLMSILGYEYDINLIAAILTLIGYSLNDTIVVYDRIRENMTAMRGSPMKDMINTSVAQTLSRTIVTGVTSLLAVLALFFLGGPVLEGFSLTLFLGILVGTYSSIFVSSPIVYLWPAKK